MKDVNSDLKEGACAGVRSCYAATSSGMRGNANLRQIPLFFFVEDPQPLLYTASLSHIALYLYKL